MILVDNIGIGISAKQILIEIKILSYRQFFQSSKKGFAQHWAK